MTRSRTFSIVVGGLVSLGLAACSFSFKAGGSSSAEAGKPARGGAEGSSPSSKPIAQGDPAPADPEADPVTDPGAGDPEREPPAVEEPPPVVEPQLTAVCRVTDPTLEALCHRVFDPMAADDLQAWVGQLAAGAVLIRPAHEKGMQRLRGVELIEALAERSGGLRELLHLRPTDRLVVTVSNDCRRCRRTAVVFEANTRSGAIVVTVDMTQPPSVSLVEIGTRVRRMHLGQARNPKPSREPEPAVSEEPQPSEEPSEEPTKDPSTTVKTPSAEVVAPSKEGGGASKKRGDAKGGAASKKGELTTEKAEQ